LGIINVRGAITITYKRGIDPNTIPATSSLLPFLLQRPAFILFRSILPHTTAEIGSPHNRGCIGPSYRINGVNASIPQTSAAIESLLYFSGFDLSSIRKSTCMKSQDIILMNPKKSTNHNEKPNTTRMEPRIMPVMSKALPFLLFIPVFILFKSMLPVTIAAIVRQTPIPTYKNMIYDINPWSAIKTVKKSSNSSQKRK